MLSKTAVVGVLFIVIMVAISAAVSCFPGEYYDHIIFGNCQLCTNCTHGVEEKDMEPACKQQSHLPCPQWCSSQYSMPPNVYEPKYNCPDDPVITTTQTPEHTTPYGSTSSIITTAVPVDTTSVPTGSSSSSPTVHTIVIIVGVLVLVILFAVVAYKCYSKKECVHVYRKLHSMRFGKTTLTTFMINPTSWQLELTGYNQKNRFWLTVTNTDTNQDILSQTEWKPDVNDVHRMPKMTVRLPEGGGSFSAEVEITKKFITEHIGSTDCLKINVPSDPCTCSLEQLMSFIGELDSVYNQLCFDLNSLPDSVKKIAIVMERTESCIQSIIQERNIKPFEELMVNATAEGSFDLAYIVMGLTRGDRMSAKEKRVIKYILDWHSNCQLCRCIEAQNTGASWRVVESPTTEEQINFVV